MRAVVYVKRGYLQVCDELVVVVFANYTKVVRYRINGHALGSASSLRLAGACLDLRPRSIPAINWQRFPHGPSLVVPGCYHG